MLLPVEHAPFVEGDCSICHGETGSGQEAQP
jgi:predicted CXXCH cytochrome family protein